LKIKKKYFLKSLSKKKFKKEKVFLENRNVLLLEENRVLKKFILNSKLLGDANLLLKNLLLFFL